MPDLFATPGISNFQHLTSNLQKLSLIHILNCLNISQASRELFIHRHTMKYRLNQIEELTEMPLDVPGNVFKLHLGLLIYDYLHARGTL